MSEAAGAMVGLMTLFFWIIGAGSGILRIVARWMIYEKAGEPGWASLIPYYRDYVFFKISWGNGWYFLLTSIPGVVALIIYFSFFMDVISQSIINPYAYENYAYSNLVAGSVGIIIFIYLLLIYFLVINIITSVKLAKAFGQSGGFACGLIFLQTIFICIMAFSKDIHYVGIPGKMPPYGAGYGGPNPQNRQTNWQNPYHQANGYQQSPPQYGPSQGWGWQPPEQQNNPYREPYSTSPDAEPQTPPQDVAKYCPDCGMPLKKEDAFCPRCGKPQ